MQRDCQSSVILQLYLAAAASALKAKRCLATSEGRAMSAHAFATTSGGSSRAADALLLAAYHAKDMSDTTVEKQERRRKAAAQRRLRGGPALLRDLNATCLRYIILINHTLLACCIALATTGIHRSSSIKANTYN